MRLKWIVLSLLLMLPAMIADIDTSMIHMALARLVRIIAHLQEQEKGEK
uniref:Uncharacterized protein n=1 Tax=Onchocerca volvulus TaxID=6282 RepID=A0A8R1TP54_ONCVO